MPKKKETDQKKMQVCTQCNHCAPTNGPNNESTPTDDGQICPICLETVKDEEKTDLGCGHGCHGQCLISWIVMNDTSCPTCRYNPRDDEPDAGDDDRPDIDDTSVDLRAALKSARADKKNKSTVKNLLTIKKWRKEMENERKKLRQASETLKPFEKELREQQIRACKELEAAHESKHFDEIHTRRMARKAVTKASSQWRNAQMRLARKYDWNGPTGLRRCGPPTVTPLPPSVATCEACQNSVITPLSPSAVGGAVVRGAFVEVMIASSKRHAQVPMQMRSHLHSCSKSRRWTTRVLVGDILCVYPPCPQTCRPTCIVARVAQSRP